MNIKLNVDYNEHFRKGSNCPGMAPDLKARLVKCGLASEVTPEAPIFSKPKPKKA